MSRWCGAVDVSSPPPPADDDLHARIPHVGPADDAATVYDELQKRFETLRK